MIKLTGMSLLTGFFFLALCSILFLPQAQAATVIFSDRKSFNDALDSDPSLIKRVEGWDTFAPLTVFPNGTTVNGITYNVSTGEAKVVSTGVSLSPPNNLFQTAGFDFAPLVDTFTFEFEQPIFAFGITFSSTFAKPDGSYVLRNELGDVVSSFFDPVIADIGQFAGFTSDRPFRQIEVSSTVNALYGMDDLTTAVVPIPAALPLLASGLAGLGLVGWRRKKAR